MRRSRLAVALVVIVAAGAAVFGAATHATTATPSHGANTVSTLASLFTTNPLLGGQVAPRQYKWANDDVALFVQFDRPNPADATVLRYVGIGLRSTFCAETQPGGASGGFTHFHRLTSPTYAQGHGGPPGAEGYWLIWIATDAFTSGDGRKVKPGVDYQFSPTPPPACGSAIAPTFAGPDAHTLTAGEIRQLATVFHDNPFRGGQTAPRLYRWVNGDVLVWLQFDKADPAKATRLRYIGVAERGTFCSADQPSADFTHFDRLTARTYAKAAGGAPGQGGFWSLALAVDRFTMPWGPVTPGVDRKFAPTPAPNCPKA